MTKIIKNKNIYIPFFGFLTVFLLAGYASYLIMESLPVPVEEPLCIFVGEDVPEAQSWFTKLKGDAEFVDESAKIDTEVPGEYSVVIEAGKREYSLGLHIIDNVPPAATPVDTVSAVGETLKPDNFFVDLFDHSDVKAEFVNPPDFSQAGFYDVEVLLTDEYDNQTVVKSACEIFEIVPEIVVEKGEIKSFTVEDFASYSGVSECIFEEELPQGYESRVGEYEVHFLIRDCLYSSKIVVRKTTPPDIVPKESWTVLGFGVPSDELFDIIRSDDGEDIQSEFVSEPDWDSPGVQAVSVRVFDAYGNDVEIESKLRIYVDYTPPVIRGARSFTVALGNPIVYRHGITVTDNYDESPKWEIDTSEVNPNMTGTYPVTHTATDKSGNSSSVTVLVTIVDVTEKMLHEYADQKLDDLGVFEMTDPVERAARVHEYVYSCMSYKSKPNYSPDELIVVYNALTTMSGDCHASQLVSEVLLTRAGIENMRINNIECEYSHVWNLIKIDGLWYHYDATLFKMATMKDSHMFTDATAKILSEKRTNLGGMCYVYDADSYPAIVE